MRAAVILTSTLIRDYMLNYARSLIYTTSLSHANIISVDCSFDLLEDGTAKKVMLLPHQATQSHANTMLGDSSPTISCRSAPSFWPKCERPSRNTRFPRTFYRFRRTW